MQIALIGSGSMGSALAAGWRERGARVVTAREGRSARTLDLAARAGLELVPTLADALDGADLVVSVVPPGAAVDVARAIAAIAAGRPLVVDLNAVAPETMDEIARVLRGFVVVDGSISGGPPGEGARVRVYLSGPRAGDVPANARTDVVVLDEFGAASALKMCTASMYKGVTALVMQALLTADAHGVREEFLADVARRWPDDVPGWPAGVAVAATKAWRFVDEMHEIARTQAGAGLAGELFDGVAAAYARAAHTPLGGREPESVAADIPVDEVIAGLRD